MTVRPHTSFSQRATCPPSAAVRQRSIAVITFIWSRLTWPRLASRQAGPWSRKMSATSRAGRAMTAWAQAAAIAEREQHVHLEIARHGEQALGLIRAHDEGQLLRLLDVVDLGSEIVSPERHPKQEPHSGHDPVAIGNARPALDEMKLEAADVVGRGGIRGALEECREPPAAVDVAPLRVATELACGHVLDHPLAQRANGAISRHG